MRLHRFYVGPNIGLTHDFHQKNDNLIHQWKHVLRLIVGQSIVLFDGVGKEGLYKIVELSGREARLQLITNYEPKLPKRDVYLLWALLKKDKNDWVLQKGTELGVSHFLPLLADRSEKTGFNEERARKIVIEAAEQCGRSDIPEVRGPMRVKDAIEELKGKIELYICEQGNESKAAVTKDIGALIGPEGGWSDEEQQLFKQHSLKHLNLNDFTLRAETAAVVAAAKLIQ